MIARKRKLSLFMRIGVVLATIIVVPVIIVIMLKMKHQFKYQWAINAISILMFGVFILFVLKTANPLIIFGTIVGTLVSILFDKIKKS